ncbi:hypothetical protein [Rhizobium laguerreae]|uniref:hypothetical protein n=1 Tax=Rhizobium laguerreae TaxID=1076926 RepID=UPI003703A8E1
MAALVVKHDGEFTGKPHHDVAPDAEIRSERIGKDDHRPVGRGTNDLIMDRHVVYAGELHVTLLLNGEIDWLIRLSKMIFIGVSITLELCER